MMTVANLTNWYVGLSALLFLILGAVWTREDPLNLILKIAFFGFSMAGAAIIAKVMLVL